MLDQPHQSYSLSSTISAQMRNNMANETWDPGGQNKIWDPGGIKNGAISASLLFILVTFDILFDLICGSLSFLNISIKRDCV